MHTFEFAYVPSSSPLHFGFLSCCSSFPILESWQEIYGMRWENFTGFSRNNKPPIQTSVSEQKIKFWNFNVLHIKSDCGFFENPVFLTILDLIGHILYLTFLEFCREQDESWRQQAPQWAPREWTHYIFRNLTSSAKAAAIFYNQGIVAKAGHGWWRLSPWVPEIRQNDGNGTPTSQLQINWHMAAYPL